jgi:Domain of unknown function (DUF5710)
MHRTYLFVPPEQRAEVETLGAHWDSTKKCWYVDGAPSLSLARWSSIREDDEYSVISNDAYVASTSIPCPHCGQETEVIAIHCLRGMVLDEPLERFTISDIRAVDEALLQELQRWPSFRRTAERDEFGDFANHCAACGDVIGDIHLHSEPEHAFFDIVHAVSGAVTLVPLARTIRLSGNEHFVIE